MDDRQLWEGIRRKDESAFNTLYRSYGAGLLGFLKQFLGNRQAAEDVAQETFAGIWQHPNGFDPGRGTLRSYVFGVGRKRAAEWWRKTAESIRSRTRRGVQGGNTITDRKRVRPTPCRAANHSVAS